MPTWTVRDVAPWETAPLRREVLRGGAPVVITADETPGVVFLGAFNPGGDLVASGHVGPFEPPFDRALVGAPTGPAWRLGGMASDPEVRGQGAGSAVLRELLVRSRAEGAALVWCNARTAARTFYARAGLSEHGEVWDAVADGVPIGPHVVMWGTV